MIQDDPPPEFQPFTSLTLKRRRGRGRLCATWYPALGKPRGAVILLHPWVPWGKAYFHRRGRLPMLRAEGFHALTFDLGGVGRSDPAPMDFRADDVETAFGALEERAEGLPLLLWGISAGGYWAHLLPGRLTGVCGAVFEDVSAHLIEWSKRMAPWAYPAYLLYQHGLPQAYRFLDLRRHAPLLCPRAVAYVGGGNDRGVLPAETRELARLAGGECLLVPGADHLEAIKVAEDEILALALRTFERALGKNDPLGSSRSRKRG